MTFWDVLLVWLLAKVLGASGGGPRWPGPTGPTGPTGTTGPTGPSPTGPTGPTGGTGPTGPAEQTVWKPYFYVQPDAGAAYGTPYALAAEWHGQGTAWTDMYNYTRGKPIAASSAGKLKDVYASYVWKFPLTNYKLPASTFFNDQRYATIAISSSGEVWLDAAAQKVLDEAAANWGIPDITATQKAIGDKLRSAFAGGVPYGTVVTGDGEPSQQSTVVTPDFASKGDKLLVPWTWPETTKKAILDRCQPIPSGTVLPGVKSSGVNGDECSTTI